MRPRASGAFLQELTNTPLAQRPTPAFLASEAVTVGLTALAIDSFRNRPVGWVNTNLVRVGPSNVHGMGLFAVREIAKGTRIGRYPGRLRTEAEMDRKLERVPHASEYLYQTQVSGLKVNLCSCALHIQL